MAGGRGLDGWISGERLSIPSLLEEKARRAYRLVEELRLGRIIGRVARHEPVGVRPGGRVLVEVSPEVYYREPGPYRRIGDYLVIVDLKGETVVLARVTGIERRDLLSHLAPQPPPDSPSWEVDPYSLATQTLVEVEPVMEARLDGSTLGDEPVPAVSSIEPQSPVVDPEPGLLQHLLSLPEEGLLLGALATPAGLAVEGRVPVRLPYKALLQHTLIIGTTGSGKTTLLKNMAAYAYSKTPPGKRPVMVFVDMNQDFVQLAFPAFHEDSLARDPVSPLYKGVRAPGRLVVLVPAARSAVLEAGPGEWPSVALGIAERYTREVLAPAAGLSGYGADYELRVVEGEGLAAVEASFAGGKVRVVIVPYAINTTRDPGGRVASLLHGLTMLARDFLYRSRERAREALGAYPPLPAVAAGLYAYADYLSRRRDERHVYDPSQAIADVLSSSVAARVGGESAALNAELEGFDASLMDVAVGYYEVLLRMLPHRGTVEALYRRVSALVDAGMVDVPVAAEDRVYVAPEPGWEWITRLARSLDAPIVLDLAWDPSGSSAQGEQARLAAYRMLDSLRAWRQAEWARRRSGLDQVLVVIDEAHQFFPQEKGPREEQEASRHVAGMIARIARLGRARGIGLVFATHSPRDLHDIILQLANTKILLRTEKAQAEHLDVPGDVKALLPRLPDRHMFILSHVYREGYVMAATTLPLTLHYDLSASH